MRQSIQCRCGSRFNVGVVPGFGLFHAKRI
jgi:hypothetical protein